MGDRRLSAEERDGRLIRDIDAAIFAAASYSLQEERPLISRSNWSGHASSFVRVEKFDEFPGTKRRRSVRRSMLA